MNTKYISSSVLKTSEFSRVRNTSENSDDFNSRDEKYLVPTKNVNFHFILYFYAKKTPTEKGGAENAKTNFF